MFAKPNTKLSSSATGSVRLAAIRCLGIPSARNASQIQEALALEAVRLGLSEVLTDLARLPARGVARETFSIA
jgi:hypothetical protein